MFTYKLKYDKLQIITPTVTLWGIKNSLNHSHLARAFKIREEVFYLPVILQRKRELYSVYSVIDSIHLTKFNSEEFEIYIKGEF